MTILVSLNLAILVMTVLILVGLGTWLGRVIRVLEDIRDRGRR